MKIIAEIGAAHNGKLKNVFRLMEETVQADYFKIQVWTPDSMSVPYWLKDGPWAGEHLTKLYQKAHLPWAWCSEIFDYGNKLGRPVFASPFDKLSVDFLERLHCPMYKIASFEVVDLELVEYVAKTEKPIILSTGQVTHEELEQVLEVVVPHTSDITLLHCVSQYPTGYSEANLESMLALKAFGYPVGISDHTPGSTVPIAATALGAEMIEKHIGLSDRGLDGGFSMRPYQFNSMGIKVRDTQLALGHRYAPPEDLHLRRSLYFSENLPAGTRVFKSHLKTARPNLGLCPLQMEKILGHELTEDVLKNQPVSLQLV